MSLQKIESNIIPNPSNDFPNEFLIPISINVNCNSWSDYENKVTGGVFTLNITNASSNFINISTLDSFPIAVNLAGSTSLGSGLKSSSCKFSTSSITLYIGLEGANTAIGNASVSFFATIKGNSDGSIDPIDIEFSSEFTNITLPYYISSSIFVACEISGVKYESPNFNNSSYILKSEPIAKAKL
ncbi:hypothetical protein KCM76_22615 [Zooshikella marina]|uniref:hypothetical protein n=1 Tax=Zooshikella ganghwensis TaxID=202772 RepID=UPI001BAF3D40|nr:hypothetical protein [Zooshikella ganghwensis]MBU2708804.1 hypothetical protein [Zooshikella ganghwensis]